MPSEKLLPNEKLRAVTQVQAELRNSLPTCRVYHNTTQTVATTAVVLFNSEHWDRWGWHSTSSNTSRITVGFTGLYLVGGSYHLDADAAGYAYVACTILRNGTDFVASSPLSDVPNNIVPVGSVATIVNLIVGDYIELRLDYSRNSGGNTTVQAANTTTNFRSNGLWASWVTGQ